MEFAGAPWAFLPSRFTLVSRLAARDGIARFSEQLLERIGDSREVKRIPVAMFGPDEGGTVHLRGGLRLLRLLRMVPRRRPIVLMWNSAYFIHGRVPERLVTYAALGVLMSRRTCFFVVHELEDARSASGRLRSGVLAIEERFRRAAFGRAHALVVHSQWERDRFEARFPAADRAAYVVPHGNFFHPESDVDRDTARQRLALPGDAFIFACVGFIAPKKGFDRAVGAFAALPASDRTRLYIVGSPLGQTPDVLDHLEELREMTARVPCAELVEGYLSDEDFDLWLRAADVVITPYREAASSSVVARALMLGTPLITSATGALREQAGAGDEAVVVIRDDEQLVTAMAAKLTEAEG